MEAEMDNDTRGWIMCVTSGIACVVGASIICVDVLVRYIPSKRNFRIEESNVFLASSLSLSFGVMLFSALYSMLPSSKNYLIKSGFSPSTAAWILLGCFMGGFAGIQTLSRFLHHYIPSHVVDCDHNHEEESNNHIHHQSRTHSRGSQGGGHGHDGHGNSRHAKLHGETGQVAIESTPLLFSETEANGKILLPTSGIDTIPNTHQQTGLERRPSMMEVVPQRLLSFVKDTKNNCDSTGPCYGYSDPCGQECFKHIGGKTPNNSRHPTFLRTTTGNFSHRHLQQVPGIIDEEGSSHGGRSRSATSTTRVSRVHSRELDAVGPSSSRDSESCEDEDLEVQHHHHVSENAFMSIGLQTSVAIALHKLPEGFITYATNHANPSLGFSVFMALFVHNITEGFALALPLYLALGSRIRAMFWASLLGGVSQPLGAGIAAAWFKIAGHEGNKPGSEVYGCMFAITAGIMVSVALQLFVESLSLNHNRNLCIAFGFIGMAIMAASNALTS